MDSITINQDKELFIAIGKNKGYIRLLCWVMLT